MATDNAEGAERAEARHSAGSAVSPLIVLSIVKGAPSPMPRVPVSTSRGLGLWSATALVVGHTIAVGIFLTPAELIGSLASPALTIGLWVACGALVLTGAFTFGELAARYPLAGGPYIYLREGWGERVAFLYGWQSLLVMDPGITAALVSDARPPSVPNCA